VAESKESGVRGHLVLVQLTVLVLLLALGTEGDDNETHKDVHHEECNDNDVDDEEHGYFHMVIVDGTLIFCMCIDGLV
jgi:hypothetical protein